MQVQQIMEPYRNRGHLLVLTTAAPAFYAHPISEFLNMDLCCGTLLPSEVVIGQWQENVGQQKVEALKRLLQVHKAEIDVVITDHSDDLPLLNFNTTGRNIVVGANPKALKRGARQSGNPLTHDVVVVDVVHRSAVVVEAHGVPSLEQPQLLPLFVILILYSYPRDPEGSRG